MELAKYRLCLDSCTTNFDKKQVVKETKINLRVRPGAGHHLRLRTVGAEKWFEEAGEGMRNWNEKHKS